MLLSLSSNSSDELLSLAASYRISISISLEKLVSQARKIKHAYQENRPVRRFFLFPSARFTPLSHFARNKSRHRVINDLVSDRAHTDSPTQLKYIFHRHHFSV
jgi:hypothetical protein